MYGKIVEKFNLEGKGIIFRYPKSEDLDSLLRTINSLVEEKAMLTIQEKQTKREETKWLTDQLNKIKNKQGVFLVVEVEGKIMGSAGVKKQERLSENHIGELGISLRKEIRGKGIGTRLLKRTMKEAKKVLKVKIIRLRTMGINKIAQRLYQKCGFKEVGRIKRGLKCYRKYVDEVIMVKYL